MDMTVKEVRAALTRLKRVRASRASRIPVLTTIRIDADGLHATDMDAYLSITADTGLDGAVQVDPVAFGGALKGLKGSDLVVLELAGDGLRVNGVTLPSLDAAEWPDLPVVDAEAKPMPAGMYDAMRDVANAAASGDESRPVLTCVQVQVQGDSVRITATDSYRLARVMLLGGETFDGTDVIVPVKCGKYLDALPAATSMAVSGERVVLRDADSLLTLRRRDAQFPNADQLIPNDWEVTGTTDGLLPIVERIEKVAGKYAPMAVRVENGELSAGYRGADSSVDPVLVSDGWDHADELTVGVNAAFLRDGLRFVGEGEPVRMISELRPVLLGGKYDRCYLVMPVRLKTDVNDPFAAAALSAV